MRHFHSITLGVILDNLVFKDGKYEVILEGNKKKKIGEPGLIPHLTRSTLNRREVDLGFAKPGRTRRQWRLFDPDKANAFMIAVLEYYDKMLPPELEEAMENPRVRSYLDKARREAIRQESKRQTDGGQHQIL